MKSNSPQLSRPMSLLQKGLALLIIAGGPKEFRFVTTYTADAFHYTALPAVLVPSMATFSMGGKMMNTVLTILWLVRIILASLILLDIAVPLCFGALGASMMYMLFLSPLHYHHNAYLLALLCLWMIFCDDASSQESVPYWQYLVFLIQITAVYGFSALHKIVNPEWRSGLVLFAYAQHNVFPFLASRLSASVTAWMAPFVIALELFLACALWIPGLRRWAVIFGVLFHMTIEAATDVGYFSWEMMLLYIGVAGLWCPTIIKPLGRMTLLGILLMGLRGAFPVWTIARYLAVPLGLLTAVILFMDTRNDACLT